MMVIRTYILTLHGINAAWEAFRLLSSKSEDYYCTPISRAPLRLEFLSQPIYAAVDIIRSNGFA